MKITNIKRQKKQTDRYSIYLDDKFWLGVSQDILIQYGLYKDQILDQDLMDKIQKSENNYKLYAKAIHYLSFGLRSKKEMKDYLLKQGENSSINQELIETILEKLEVQGYLNDLEFAKAYVRTKSQLNRKGPRLIQQDLLKKGLKDDDIRQALDEYSKQEIHENIHRLADKFIRSKSKLPPKMLEGKLYQHLLTKGFESALIQEYIQEMELDIDDDKQRNNLAEEAEKLLRKNRRKYSEYALKQKTSQSLFAKGYDYELINEWLDEHSHLFEED